jgi:hypothetical protein
MYVVNATAAVTPYVCGQWATSTAIVRGAVILQER